MLKNIIIKILSAYTLILAGSNPVLADNINVTFAYIGARDHSALRGVQQGLEEANLQGQFLNQTYKLDIILSDNVLSHDFSPYLAVLTAVDSDTFTELSAALINRPVFNLSIADDKLRVACLKNALHIVPSNKMKQDAIKQWQKQASGTTAKAQAWHPDFVKFAARDLNKRYKKKFNISMDDYSWAGWAAVKMTSDAVARTNITDPTQMLNHIKTALSFDGQKGIDMNFRETGQLRQPLLLIENDKIVAEAPVRGIANITALDSLGILSCEK